MQYIATFDVGTTAVKGVLVNVEGNMVVSDSINIPTIFRNGFKEQNPDVWYNSFCEISRRFTKVYGAQNIIGIVMSGQMQDLIALDSKLQPVCNAILYSDGRAVHQAHQTEAILGNEYLKKVTGNNYDGSLTFPKILWIKENMPEVFAKIFKVLVSSKDYIIA